MPVTIEVDEVGKFGVANDMTAASYENTARPLAHVYANRSVTLGAEQPTAVSDVHDDDRHILSPIHDVAVRSLILKFSPITVIELPPVSAKLDSMADMSGASKMKSSPLLTKTASSPSSPPELRIPARSRMPASNANSRDWQRMAEVVDHDDVRPMVRNSYTNNTYTHS